MHHKTQIDTKMKAHDPDDHISNIELDHHIWNEIRKAH